MNTQYLGPAVRLATSGEGIVTPPERKPSMTGEPTLAMPVVRDVVAGEVPPVADAMADAMADATQDSRK